MRLRLMYFFATAGLAGLMGVVPAGAAPPQVPPQADVLLWCSSVYDGWSRAVHYQHLAQRSRALAAIARQLEDRGIAALDGGYSDADIKSILRSYASDYAAALTSSDPPRYDPERCQSLLEAG